MQCAGDFPVSRAKHLGGAEPHVLRDLPGHHRLWLHRGGAPGVPLCRVREVPGVQFETQAFKVLVFPVGNRVPGSSRLMTGHSA